MQRGEIWNIDFESHQPEGHEQAGIRPAIIVNVEPDPQNPMCMVVPGTSKTKASRFPHTITINPNSTNGLDLTTTFMIFQLRAIDRRRLKNKRGEIDIQQLEAIEKLLLKMLGL